MPGGPARTGNDYIDLVRRFGAWVVLFIVAWIAIGMYSGYRADLRSTGSPRQGSTESTESVDSTNTAPEAESGEEPVASSPVVIVLADGLNFRTKPMTNSEVIRKLDKDTELELLEKAEGWYKVRDTDGVEGWVAAGGQYTDLVE